MMTVLQVNLALSPYSSCLFPVPFGSNIQIPSKSSPSLPHFSISNHSNLHLTNSRVLRNPSYKIDSVSKTRIAKSRITCSAKSGELESSEIVKEKSVSVILLAGGKGKRMGANMPKQYLPLLGQPIALYSFYTFSHLIEVKEIIVVCDPSYEDIFEDTKEKIHVDLKFALPGKERQDSVYSGLQAVDLKSELVCIHDSARPLVTSGDVKKVLKDGWLNGAAVLGVPAKATIKEANSESFVVKTLNRKTLWEMQTPQVIKPELLKKGFELVNRRACVVEVSCQTKAYGQLHIAYIFPPHRNNSCWDFLFGVHIYHFQQVCQPGYMGLSNIITV